MNTSALVEMLKQAHSIKLRIIKQFHVWHNKTIENYWVNSLQKDKF